MVTKKFSTDTCNKYDQARFEKSQKLDLVSSENSRIGRKAFKKSLNYAFKTLHESNTTCLTKKVLIIDNNKGVSGGVTVIMSKYHVWTENLCEKQNIKTPPCSN